MKYQTFSIHELADSLYETISRDMTISKETFLFKVIACLQRNIDTQLVPNNFNRHVTRKKKDMWVKEIKRCNEEITFWKETVKSLDGERIAIYYDQLNQILRQKGFNKLSSVFCFYCERRMDAGEFGGENEIHSTTDHVVPKSKFGKNTWDNLVSACNECNSLKDDMTVRVFIEKLKTMIRHNVFYKTLTPEIYPVIIKNASKLLTAI